MTIRTQLALLALVAGIVAPAIAMDYKKIGKFQGAGIAGMYITNILEQKELERKEQEAKNAQAQQAQQAQQKAAQEAADLKSQQAQEQAAQEEKQAEERAKLEEKQAAEKAQAQEQARLEAEAEAARVKKALDEQATVTTIPPTKRRPKGQSGKQKPSGKIVITPVEELQLDVEVEKPEQAEPKAPAKVNVGKSYGVNLGTLGAIKLKKTGGAEVTPARPTVKPVTTPQEAALSPAAKEIIAQYQLLDAANQKLELAYSLRAYAENPSPVTKLLIMEYAIISKQLELTPQLADALTKLFEAKDAASYKIALENIKTNILKVV